MRLGIIRLEIQTPLLDQPHMVEVIRDQLLPCPYHIVIPLLEMPMDTSLMRLV
jgi:hypothetical protein